MTSMLKLRPMAFLAYAAFSAMLLGAHGVRAQECAPISVNTGKIAVSSGWVRTPPPGAKVAAGYMRINNLSEKDDQLLSVASTRAGRVEMHKMEMNGSMMSMRPMVYGAKVPAGGVFTFSTSGAHMMFINMIGGAFAEGDKIPVRLTFRESGRIDACLTVKANSPAF